MINKFKTIVNTENKKTILSNFLSLSTLQMFNYILPLITLPYIIRVVGIDYFGIIAFALAIVTYFQIIVNYGFNLTATRDISKNKESIDKISEIFSVVMIVKTVLFILSTIVFIALILFIDKFQKNWEIYLYTFLMIPGQLLFPMWFFQGIEKMKYVTYLNIVARLFFTVCLFIFVTEKSDYYLIPLFTSLGYIFVGIYSIYLIFTKYNIKFRFQSIKRIIIEFKTGWYIFLSQLKTSLFSITNPVILGFLINETAVGYFTAAEKLIRAMASLQGPVTGSLFPYIARSINENKNDTIKKIFKISKIGASVYFIIILILFIFADLLIELLYGANMQAVSNIFKILLLVPLSIFLNNMFGTQILLNVGKEKQFFFVVILSIITSLVTLVPLTYYYSYYGTAISMLTTELVVAFGMYYYVNKEIQDIRRGT